MKTFSRGFSLYELIVAISIMGVILSFSFPLVYQQILAKNNAMAIVQLKSVFKVAQEEAQRRNTQVVVCAANYNVNGYLTTNGCLGSNDWSEGNLAYIDLNNGGGYDSSERLSSIPLPTGMTVSVSPSVESMGVTNAGEFIDRLGTTTGWSFTISQTRFGQTVCSSLTLTSYGYFSIGTTGC